MKPRRRLIVSLVGLAVIAAIAIPLGIRAASEEDAGRDVARPSRSAKPVDVPAPESPTPPGSDGGGPVSFGQFPLDLGWAEVHGSNAINGPGPGAGGISMPEGHCNEEVLFGSGYQDKLSTYVTVRKSSRTREILGYPSADAARSTFEALGDAVASCAVFDDAYSGEVAYSAEVYDSIDEANARAGMTTFTFGYTSDGSAPFGVLYQFAIADDVLYGSNDYGDWTTETASGGVDALDEENASVIPLLSRIER